MRCCPTYPYHCFYGNAARSYTQECDYYWLDGEETEALVTKDTLYTATCQEEANNLALELAQYRAQEAAPCAPCCYKAICISLPYPGDATYLQYFTASQGVLFSQDVTLYIEIISDCETPAGFETTFLNQTGVGVTGGTVVEGEIKLKGGVLYAFGIDSTVDSITSPNSYTLGWDCQSTCPPAMRADAALQFPFGIAKCIEL